MIGNIMGLTPMLLGFLGLSEIIYISANKLPVNYILIPFSIIIIQFTCLIIQQIAYKRVTKELEKELAIWQEKLKNSYIKKK